MVYKQISISCHDLSEYIQDYQKCKYISKIGNLKNQEQNQKSLNNKYQLQQFQFVRRQLPMKNNIFAQQQYRDILELNKRKLKTIEAQYFKNEYDKVISQKQKLKQLQKQERQLQREEAKHKHRQYYDQINRQRQKRQFQKQYLSSDYSQTIDYHQNKNRYEKNINHREEDNTLTSPTWLRDTSSERESTKKKQHYYNQALQQHLRIKEERKKQEKQIDSALSQQIKRQADQMLQKQYQYLEAKHRQKSLFQKRQNQILGVPTIELNMENSRTSEFEKNKQILGAQRQLYRQGLQAQFEKQQQDRLARKRNFTSQRQQNNVRYNPISNPIPFVYKNPNVLRMLSS